MLLFGIPGLTSQRAWQTLETMSTRCAALTNHAHSSHLQLMLMTRAYSSSWQLTKVFSCLHERVQMFACYWSKCTRVCCACLLESTPQCAMLLSTVRVCLLCCLPVFVKLLAKRHQLVITEGHTCGQGNTPAINWYTCWCCQLTRHYTMMQQTASLNCGC